MADCISCNFLVKVLLCCRGVPDYKSLSQNIQFVCYGPQQMTHHGGCNSFFSKNNDCDAKYAPLIMIFFFSFISVALMLTRFNIHSSMMLVQHGKIQKSLCTLFPSVKHILTLLCSESSLFLERWAFYCNIKHVFCSLRVLICSMLDGRTK